MDVQPGVEVDGIEPAVRTVEQLYEDFVASLPLVGFAIVILIVGATAAFVVGRGVRRALRRVTADAGVVDFTVRLVRLAAIIAAALLALAVAGIRVGPALAGLGLAGLAVAFAVQSILENFIAGVVLLIRRPFRSGDQIRTNEFEGTVLNMDMRVTRLLDYNGELILIPNFEVRYWTAPDIRSVTYTRDLVLAAIKTAIARAGMTIPWPIRTLVLDGPLEVTGGSGLRLDGTSRPGTPIPDR